MPHGVQHIVYIINIYISNSDYINIIYIYILNSDYIIQENYIEVERDDSPIMFCGYKRVHPLEERIMFTVKMRGDDLKMIVVLFKNVCLELEAIVGEILKEAQAKL